MGYQGSRWTAHVTSPSHGKGYWTCTAIEMLACLVFKIFKKSQQIHCTAPVTSRASPHWPTQDSTHLIGWEWIISSSPRSAASHLRPTLLVETEPCPAWARVWVGCAGRLGHSRQLTARLLQAYRVFLAYHRKLHELQLHISAINKIPANWANTSPTSFPQNKWNIKWNIKWNHETNGYKCKTPFVINEKNGNKWLKCSQMANHDGKKWCNKAVINGSKW